MAKTSAKTSAITTIRPRRAAPVFVCKKCLKRVDDGPALKRELKSELKRRSAAQGVKRPRVIMTGCMDICPKRAVVAASGATLARGEYLLLADGDGAVEAAALLTQPGLNQSAPITSPNSSQASPLKRSSRMASTGK